MHGEDLRAALEVGSIHPDLAVEAARAQQGGVQDVGAVGGRDEDHVRLDVEAIHLDQQLVEGLLTLVVTAAHAGAAVAADRVDLVDEDDGRRVLLRLLEQVAHAARADTDEHLDEVRARDRVERHAGLTRDGAGEQGLAGSGRAVQQHALRDAGADGLEARGVFQEVLDLVQLFDGLFGTGDVGEGHLRGVFADQLRLRLAELHDAVAAVLHARQQEPDDHADQQEREEDADQAQEPVGLGNVVVEVGVARVDRLDDLETARLYVVELHERAVVGVIDGVRVGERQVDPLLAVDDLHLVDRRALEKLESLLRRDLLEARSGSDELEGDDQADDAEGHPDEGAADETLEDVHEVARLSPPY